MATTIPENSENNYDCEIETDAGCFSSGTEKRILGEERNSASRYPILTKELYFSDPPIEELHRMSLEELTRVPNFKVYNKYGSIEWLGLTDVTDVNIDTTVHIKHQLAEVYPEDSFISTKPSEGSKLNKPAIITLEGMVFNKKVTDEESCEKICSERCESEGVTFIQSSWRE